MDKSVSGVDLDELKKAREELNLEQGVESDPNMYDDYNPNKQEQDLENSSSDNSSNKSYEEITEENYKLSLEDDEPATVSETNRIEFAETNGSSLENLSKFDAFSAFEVKENAGIVHQDEPKTNTNETQEPSNTDDSKFESIENIDELNDLLDSILSAEDDEESVEDFMLDNKNNAKEEVSAAEDFEENNLAAENSAVTEIDIEPKFEELKETQDVDSDENISEIETQIEEDEKTKLDIGSGETNETILNVNELNDYAVKEPDKELEKEPEEPKDEAEPEFIYQKPMKMENSSSETEIITDYSKLREILQNELKESDEAEEEKINEKRVSSFKPIEDFKFINEIASEEFKQADPFSYIMGKNELGETVFGNFKHHFNLAVFGKNELVINSFLNSMMLSLCLKNNDHILNFVLLDSNINSSFEVYNKSSYLYFNRIAKTNKEILDTLIEVTKELDARYEKFATVGVKNIEAFNDVSSSQPLPYIILVFNNYTSASQATNSDKINSCLYQILKFGRICGIYAVVTASNIIETSQINYNLSSRLSFKSKEDSRFTVGVEDGDLLPDENDALYFNIASGEVEHIKTATVTDMELDLIIKDLEE